jgi:hypothetical protein
MIFLVNINFKLINLELFCKEAWCCLEVKSGNPDPGLAPLAG